MLFRRPEKRRVIENYSHTSIVIHYYTFNDIREREGEHGCHNSYFQKEIARQVRRIRFAHRHRGVSSGK